MLSLGSSASFDKGYQHCADSYKGYSVISLILQDRLTSCDKGTLELASQNLVQFVHHLSLMEWYVHPTLVWFSKRERGQVHSGSCPSIFINLDEEHLELQTAENWSYSPLVKDLRYE
jgi:hypothetical protein